MARAGETLTNVVTRQSVTFARTAAETDGEAIEVETLYPADSPRPPKHYHPHQEERFEVLAGTINVLLDGEERAYAAGQSFTVPPGCVHEMWPAGANDVRMRWETRPALRTEQFFETVFGLGHDGKVGSSGMPGPLQMAAIADEFRDEIRLAGIPWLVQRPLLGALGLAGRLLGRPRTYVPTG